MSTDAPARREHKTFCRICEPLCGLVAVTENGRLLELKPNRDHVLSRGFMCVKGRAMTDVVYDEDRVLQPLRRTGGPGEFEPVSWDVALDDIATRLKALVHEHGPGAYAGFIGNPPAFDYATYLWFDGFQKAIGSPWKYGVNAEDGASRMFATSLLYGSAAYLMLPDLWRTRFAVIIGANPLVSHGSLVSEPRIRDALRGIVDRGGRVVVIDPRRTETARQFEHVPLHAGTDAWLLAAIVHVLFAEDLIDTAFTAAWTRNVEALRGAVAPFTPERAAGKCGVAAEAISELARGLAGAESAVVYGRTGTCTQAFGSLNNFLQDVINILTGNLDAEGGWLFPGGPIDFARFAAMGGLDTVAKTRSRARSLPDVNGLLPSRALAQDIELAGDRVRALCTLGANPVSSSAGGGPALGEALEKLDLHFSLDLYQNETNKHAHYILPVTSMYEREDLPFTFLGNMLRPSVFATDAVIERRGEVRHEWEVLNELARRMGLGGAYAFRAQRILARLGWRPMPRQIVDLVLRTSPAGDWFGLRRNGVSIKKLLRRHPDGLQLNDELPVGVIGKKLRTKGRKIDLAPQVILAELVRLDGQATDRAGDELLLIGMRETHSHNSWMHNSERLSPHGRSLTLRIHPDDAASRGLADGEWATVQSSRAKVEVKVAVSEEMFPGNVALPHGWGHDGGWQHANSLGGANFNALVDPEDGGVEALSGMSVLNGIAVRVRRT